MTTREAPAKPAPQKPTTPYPAEDARGGEIILRSRMQRAIFIAGVVGAIFLGLLLSIFAAMR
jgi:hypothetical protein